MKILNYAVFGVILLLIIIAGELGTIGNQLDGVRQNTGLSAVRLQTLSNVVQDSSL